MAIYVGCDLGGTNIKAGLVDSESGTILLEKSRPTLARHGHEVVMGRIADLIDEVISEGSIPREDVQGVGVSAPGVLDLENGRTLFFPNLPGQWRGVPLRDTVQARLGLPVYILNDARAITLGEWQFGAGRGVDTIAVIAIGTGVGGGLVINGRLHLGIGGTGGELGHQTIDYNGPLCGCGSYGCLEAYASGPAIASMGIKAVKQGLTTSIGGLVDFDLNRITPAVIAQAAQEGDQIARGIYDEVGRYIGYAVSNILATIGPRRVVIGGGVAQAGDLLLEPIRRTIKERVTVMPVDQVEVVPAALGSTAGIVGMAAWAALKGYQTN
jgi:glucokinase